MDAPEVLASPAVRCPAEASSIGSGSMCAAVLLGECLGRWRRALVWVVIKGWCDHQVLVVTLFAADECTKRTLQVT